MPYLPAYYQQAYRQNVLFIVNDGEKLQRSSKVPHRIFPTVDSESFISHALETISEKKRHRCEILRRIPTITRRMGVP